MEFQVQFWHPSDLRLWRTGYVIYVKIDWWNSNAHYSRTCLQRKINKIIGPSIPQNHLQSHISMWDTLYYRTLRWFGKKNATSKLIWNHCPAPSSHNGCQRQQTIKSFYGRPRWAFEYFFLRLPSFFYQLQRYNVGTKKIYNFHTGKW